MEQPNREDAIRPVLEIDMCAKGVLSAVNIPNILPFGLDSPVGRRGKDDLLLQTTGRYG